MATHPVPPRSIASSSLAPPSRHPQVVAESRHVVGTAPYPSTQPLMEWDEVYPDGSQRTFREVWTVVQAESGTRYGGVQVLEVPKDSLDPSAAAGNTDPFRPRTSIDVCTGAAGA